MVDWNSRLTFMENNVTDELYDYFGGNASKKVEPIEDDELDVPRADAEELSDVVDEETTATEDEVVTEEESATEEQKSGGHWDFLANMLGIGGGKSEAKKSAPKKASAAKKKPASKSERSQPKPKEVVNDAVSISKDETVKFGASETSTKSKTDFAGFDPIPSPEDDTILPSMFGKSAAKNDDAIVDEPKTAEPVNEADDLIGWAPVQKKSFSAAEDENPKRDRKPAQREPARSNAPESKAPAAKPSRRPDPVAKKNAFEVDDLDEVVDDVEEEIEGEEYVEFEIEELDNSPYKEGEDVSNGRSRRRRPAARSRDEPVEDKEEVKEERGRSRGRNRTESRDQDSEDRPRRSRSRRPRKDREAPKRSPQPAARRSREEEIPEDDIDSIDEPLSFVEDDDDSKQEEERRPKRKRRRRRRKPRSAESRKDEDRSEEASGSDDDDNFGSNVLDDDPIGDERDTVELVRDEVVGRSGNRGRGRGRSDRSSSESNDRRPRGRNARNSRDDRDDGDDARPERKRVKVPTWDEAISVVVESNIKNHARSGGGGNRGGRGRGGSGNKNQGRRR